VFDLTQASKCSEGADVGVHGSEDLSGVVDFPSNVLRSIIPVESQGINRLTAIISDVQKLHDST
jgi:hypothetical protein